MDPPALLVDHLTFAYGGEPTPVLRNVRLEVLPGQRCLLLGRNGAGKTTLLRVLAGRHMVDERVVRVLGRPAFHDTSLAADVAFLGGLFPFHSDIPVHEVLSHTPQHSPERTARLLEVLDVDPGWRMHRVSDGQRRRVQVLLGMLKPARVILLDEVTTDLDVVARADLLAFLREETTERGAAIVYATHILDGLYEWATHLCFMEHGEVRRYAALDAIPELAELRAANHPAALLRLVERWLRNGCPPAS